MKEPILAVKPGAFRLLTTVSRILVNEGIQGYLVGGFVRDLLLGRDTADIDIAVQADALATARKTADVLNGTYVPLDTENGVGRVVIPGEEYYIDFTTIKGSIEDDLARRDFTVDAIAYPLDEMTTAELETGKLIDTFGGRDDLDRGILKAVSEGVFQADPVRLLRAARIAAEAGLTIDGETEALIRRDKSLIPSVAGERVREELLRLLALPRAGKIVEYLDELGLLTAMIPELEGARGVEQPRLHVWDVLKHSVNTVAAVEYLMRDGSWEYTGEDVLAITPWSERISRHFSEEISSGSTRRSLLKLAALLHDIAKPQTKTTDETGRTRFLGHPQEGAAAAAAIMERLRFSNKEIRHVELLVTFHLRPTQMSNQGTPTNRAIYRFFRDTGETGIDVLFLSLADHLAARGETLDRSEWQGHAKMTCAILDKHFEEANIVKPVKLIDGADIMKHLGLEPGRRVGELLEAVREAQAAGEVTTKEQALEYARGLMEKTGKGDLS
jgi:poly(A) polymerase